MAKLNDRCFCHVTAAMLVSLRSAPTWRLHTKLYRFGWNTFPNNARLNNRTDLNGGEVVYISIIFHIPASWLNLLNGYDFYFRCRDTATQPYKLGMLWAAHHWLIMLQFSNTMVTYPRKPSDGGMKSRVNFFLRTTPIKLNRYNT